MRVVGIGFALVLVVLIGIFYFKNDKVPETLTSKSASGTLEQKPFRMKEAMSAKIEAPVSESPLFQKSSEQCQKTYNFFISNDLNSLGEKFTLMTPDDEQCLKLIEPTFPGFAVCRNSQVDADRSACGTALLKVRVSLVNEMYRDATNYQGMDLKILANRIFAEFMKHLEGKSTPQEYAEMKKMVDALMERNPDQVGPVKMRVVSEMMSGDGLIKSPIIDELVQKGLSIDGTDSDLVEVLLFREGLKPTAESYIQEFIRRNPDSAVAYYWLADAMWKKKVKPQTIELLQKALSLAPANPRFEKTLKFVLENPPGAGAPFIINVNANLGDL